MSTAVEPEPIDPSDEEIDALIVEFAGDSRRAIRAILHDLTELARDSETAVSRGYVRGRMLPFIARGIVDEEERR